MQVFLIEYTTGGDGDVKTELVHATLEGAKRQVEAEWAEIKDAYDWHEAHDEMEWREDYNPSEVCFGVDYEADKDCELPSWTIKIRELGP